MAGLCLATPWFDTAQACWISDLELYIQAHPWYVLFAAKHLDHICMGSMLTQLILALFFYGYGKNYADDRLWQRFVKFLLLEGPRFGVYLIGGFYALWSCTLMFLVFGLVPIVEIPPLLKEYVRHESTIPHWLSGLRGALIYMVVVSFFFAICLYLSPKFRFRIRITPPSRVVSFVFWFYRMPAYDHMFFQRTLLDAMVDYQTKPNPKTLEKVRSLLREGTSFYPTVHHIPDCPSYLTGMLLRNGRRMADLRPFPVTGDPLQHPILAGLDQPGNFVIHELESETENDDFLAEVSSGDSSNDDSSCA